MSTAIEQQLLTQLFSNYTSALRPYMHPGQTTNVSMHLVLFSIVSLSTLNQMLVTNNEMLFQWQDLLLQWQPQHYGNITRLVLPHHYTWRPDVMLLNTGGSVFTDATVNTNSILYYDGTVELITKSMYTSTCGVDIAWYPFDRQDCKLKFASWTYDSTQVALSGHPPDLETFTPNPEFFLEDFWFEDSIVDNPCCSNPVTLVTFHLHLLRRSYFIVYFFVLPAAIINMCSLMSFVLPTDCDERVSLTMNCLLAMVVFLMATTQGLPPSPTVPLIGEYYAACTIILSLCIAASVISLRLSSLQRISLPHFCRFILKYLGYALRLPLSSELDEYWDQERKDGKFNPAKLRIHPSSPIGTINDAAHITFPAVDDQDYHRRSLAVLETLVSITKKILQIHTVHTSHSPRHITSGRGSTSMSEHFSVLECQFLTSVVDRMFFLVFIIINVIFATWVMTAAPDMGQKFSFCPYGKGHCAENFNFNDCKNNLEAGRGCAQPPIVID
uniref:Acetylcholine receptor subunit alpha-1-A-like n=1 Tax=Hirondellea gigas TaxID=1518452 RepID=A0A6A7FT98_9CRUS